MYIYFRTHKKYDHLQNNHPIKIIIRFLIAGYMYLTRKFQMCNLISLRAKMLSQTDRDTVHCADTKLMYRLIFERNPKNYP